MTHETKISCPNCGQEIDVNNVIAHKLEEEYKKKYNAQLSEEKKKFQEEFDKLERQKQEVEKQKSEQVKELNRTKAEIEKINREKEELKESLETENDRKLNQQIAEEKGRIRKIEPLTGLWLNGGRQIKLVILPRINFCGVLTVLCTKSVRTQSRKPLCVITK